MQIYPLPQRACKLLLEVRVEVLNKQYNCTSKVFRFSQKQFTGYCKYLAF